eukprot:SAG31_NODE_321_length_17733_cov_41.320177_2_plen_228_part_00
MNGPCSDTIAAWKLAHGKITDGTSCLFYDNGENPDTVKIIILPCNSTGLNSTWMYTDNFMLRATQYQAGASTARCLTANPPNVNVSVAMAAVVLDARTNQPIQSALPIACTNSTTCSISIRLAPQVEYLLLVSCVTVRDTPAPVATALSMLVGNNVTALEKSKDLWWAKFWQRSAVDLFEVPIEDIVERGTLPFESQPVEGYYYGMTYILGGSYAPGKVCSPHLMAI